MNHKKMIGNLLLLLTALIWGIAFVAQRQGADKIGAATFSASRMALAAAAVWMVSLIGSARRNKNEPASPPSGKEQDGRKATLTGGLLCGLFLTASTLLQQMGLKYTSAGKAGFITALYILIVPVLNLALFRKKSSWLIWTAVGIGLAGMYLLCVTDSFRLSYGDLLVCGCALLFSGHILCCDHFVHRADPIRMSAIQFSTAAILSGILAILTEEIQWNQLMLAAIPILYCGILSGGVGYTLQMVAQKHTDPTVASLLMSLESVFAALAGTVFLNERMSLRELFGCIVLFAAILLVQIPIPQRNSRKSVSGDPSGKDGR